MSGVILGFVFTAVLGGVLLLALAAAGAEAATEAPGLRELLLEADRARGNYDGVTWQVVLEAADATRAIALTLGVQARGFDYLATVLAPPKDRGQRLLLRAGNLWFHKPDLSKPVPLSQRQRLLGEAAYGDLAATDYAHDYEIASTAAEPVEGEPCQRFELRARTPRATYELIRYWISTRRRVGVKVQYFTGAGKLLKSARMEYDNTIVGPDARSRPFVSRMLIRDELLAGRTTTLTFSAPVLRALPPQVFDVNLLAR